LHLDEIAGWIDAAFGEATLSPDPADVETLKRIVGERNYQCFLQDQVNRKIIRDYLTNAVVLGVITEAALPAFATQIASEEGRTTLALHMLMSSVEEAPDLPAGHIESEVLKPLKAPPSTHPHIKLVPS
jgi:hypothetical protein